MESMCAWYGMTRPSWPKSKHGMTSERRVRGAELASVLGYLYPFVEKAAHRPRACKAETARRNHEVADRMKVPLGIGSRSVRLRSGAALADSGCEAAGSGGLGRRVRPFRTHADVEIVGYRSISNAMHACSCPLELYPDIVSMPCPLSSSLS